MSDRSISISRRRFMLTAAAAAGATWFDVPRLFANPNDAYGGFPMGIQSYSLRGFGVDGAIEKTAELGLHYIEFFGRHYPPTHDQAKIDAFNAKLKPHKITVSAHGVAGFGANAEKNEAMFKFAKMAGIRNISADPSPDSFDNLDKLVAKYDIRIAIHNHGPGHRYNQPEDAMNAVKGRDPRIGFCADLGHYIRSGVDPVEVIGKLKGRLYGIHLKDFAEKKARTRGVILGKGHMDVPATFKALKDAKFPADGALSLEYEENPKDPIADIKECLAVAAEAAKKAAG